MSKHDQPSNAGTTADQLDRLFKPGAGSAGNLEGYRGDDGHPQPLRGDAEAPHVKVPPFATVPTLWVKDLEVPLAPDEDYLVTPAIECFQQRLLQIYFDLEIVSGGDETAMLSLIPEGSAGDDFYVVGVVDLTVTAINPDSTRFPYGTTSFGSRTFYPSELRSSAFAGAGHVRFILAYDVSPFESFRLNVRDLLGSGSNLLTMKTAFAQ